MSFQCERCGKVTDKITYKIVKEEPKEVKGLCSYCEMGIKIKDDSLLDANPYRYALGTIDNE